jgi:hypothetical protein
LALAEGTEWNDLHANWIVGLTLSMMQYHDLLLVRFAMLVQQMYAVFAFSLIWLGLGAQGKVIHITFPFLADCVAASYPSKVLRIPFPLVMMQVFQKPLAMFAERPCK